MFSELFPSIQYLRHHGVYRALQQKLAVSLFSSHFPPTQPSFILRPYEPCEPYNLRRWKFTRVSGWFWANDFINLRVPASREWQVADAICGCHWIHTLTYSTTNPTCFSTMRLTDDVPVILTTVSFMELFIWCEVGHKVSNDNAQKGNMESTCFF